MAIAERERTEHEAAEEKILEALAKVGGGRVAEDDLTFEGSKIVLPTAMEGDPRQALRVISDFIERDNQVASFERVYRYRPLDGAHALHKALYKAFGTTGRHMPVQTFFGPQPPSMKQVNVGPNEVVQVPWGEISFALFKGTIYTAYEQHREYGQLFKVIVEAPRRFRPHVEGLFKLVEEELRDNSIYRGKAIDGQPEAEFLDLSGVDPAKVVYSDEVLTQLEANVWSLLRHTDQMRNLGLPLKRAALLHGPYGTGKTLAAFLTALYAQQNGWTFIYCRPGKDKIDEVMQTARLYPPCVVFFEDVDTIADPQEGTADGVSRLLDLFDGIQAKGTELVVVMTTNHPDRIHKGMVRPGRLDAVIPIGGLDAAGVEKLARSVVAPEYLADNIDFDRVMEAVGEMETAFVKEGIDRAQRYVMARNNGEPGVLGTEDLFHAIEGLKPQLEMMHGAKDQQERDPVGVALGRVVSGQIDERLGGAQIMRHGDYFGDLQTVGENGSQN